MENITKKFLIFIWMLPTHGGYQDSTWKYLMPDYVFYSFAVLFTGIISSALFDLMEGK